MDGMQDREPGTPDLAGFDFAQLRRFPDIEAENLFAHDATDELILTTASSALAAVAAGTDVGSVAIVGERYGALTLGAAEIHGLSGIKVNQDGISGELALAANAQRLGLEGSFTSMALNGELFAGATVVLWQLPRSLEELAETAELINAHAAPDVQIIAGGRIKHMTLAMNTVLGHYFNQVIPGRAWRKSRPLVVSGPREDAPASSFPHSEFNQALGLTLCAHGATFAGTKLDIGTRFLLDFEPQMRPGAATAIDLGCGNGAIAAALATARPGLQVTATDQSASAVASTEATALVNGLDGRITSVRDDAMEGFAPASAELVVLNPPFHVGATVHAGIALKLFDAAARVLAPGGELWTVYNRHLDYRAQLEQRVGRTTIIGRNPKFTVAVSRKVS
ncbi:class I SAM-dependent methyltransferase [Arthrobacter alpinus]